MSKINVFRRAFETREDALQEISANGSWPYSLQATAGSTYPAHHHDTEETLYLLSGSLVFTEEDDGQEHRVEPGDKMLIPTGQGHSVRAVEESVYLMGLKRFIPLEGFPIWHAPANAEEYFVALNRKFGEAEQDPERPVELEGVRFENGRRFFEQVLARNLKFRRAGGGEPIGKEAFLEGLRAPGNETEAIQSSEIEVLGYSRDLVLVSLLVYLKGRRGGRPIDATFRNTRVFVRDPGEWRCVLWFNTPAGSRPA